MAYIFKNHILKIPEYPVIHNNSQTSYRDFFNTPAQISLYMYPVTTEEILHYLKSLKNSSPGYDDILPSLLRHTADYIAAPLTHVINLCFKEGCFPDNLKIAKVVPIYKSGDNEIENNYRPISILPSITKIFEKAI